MNIKENLNTKEQAYEVGYNDAVNDYGKEWDDQDSKAAYDEGYGDAVYDQLIGV